MKRKTRVLIVEDEAAIREGLQDVFAYHGYDVDSAADGEEGLRKAIAGRHDLVLLDVMLPHLDGFRICERIRERDREIPIIMLTARSADEDIIQGLRLGADDYVSKPFSVTQLVLRAQAVLRRAGGTDASPRTITLGGDLCIDVANLSATRGEHSIVFTRREMDLLAYLAANHDRAVPREELLHKVWGHARGADLETRTVDIHVAKLRRKIEPGGEPRFLLTVRGAGYRLALQ
jgi:two-component system response regulator RegX3